MSNNRILMSRRRMLAGSAAAVAALSMPGIASEPGPEKQRRVAITIDDGPMLGGRDAATFSRLSNALREGFAAEQVPVIMFVNERQLHVNGQRDLRAGVLRQWLDAGFDLGNHTFSHPNLNHLEVWQYTDDIVKGEVMTRPLAESRGRRYTWFRYPFLASGAGENARAVEEFLAQRGYRIAPVTVDYRDYSFAGEYTRRLRAGNRDEADAHLAAVMRSLDDAFARAEARSMGVLGYELPQILLIHCNEMNALTVRTMVRRIRDRGYAFISLDEAMADPAYNVAGMRPGGMGGGGYFNSLAAARRASER